MKRFVPLLLAGLLLLIPHAVSAQPSLFVYCGNLPGCGPLRNFVPGVLVQLLLRFDTYAYILGALFIMIGGGYMLLSGFNEEWMNKGKTTIIWACVGIFVAHSASALAEFISLEAGSVGAGDLVSSTINTVIGTIFDLFQLALLAVGLYCGMRMVVARGKEDEFTKARNGLFYAAIGAVFINLAEAIAHAVLTL